MRRDFGKPDRFQRTFVTLVVALVAFCALFLAIGSAQGPKLSDAAFDDSSLMLLPQQRLTLFLNQPVESPTPADVTVIPELPVQVSSDGDVVSVQFDRPLRYDTDYTLTIEGLQSRGLTQQSTVDYRWTTPSAELLYLDRGGDRDAIVRTGLTATTGRVVFRAENITSFVVVDEVMAVATAGDDAHARLQLVNLESGEVEEIRLPLAGAITQLSSSETGKLIGFTLTPREPAADPVGGRRLVVLDLDRDRIPRVVEDAAGDPLAVSDWQFMPSSSSLLALGMEGSAFILDSVDDTAPIPVGRFDQISGVSQDGTTLIAKDARGIVLGDLSQGEQRRLEPSLVEGTYSFIGDIAIRWGGDVIEKAALQAADGQFFISLAVDDGVDGRLLFRPPGGEGSIQAFALSPNGQFAVVETVPTSTNAVLDGHPTEPRDVAIVTTVVDIDTGLAVRSLEGFNVVWLPVS